MLPISDESHIVCLVACEDIIYSLSIDDMIREVCSFLLMT
jgi:hypothetical protein